MILIWAVITALTILGVISLPLILRDGGISNLITITTPNHAQCTSLVRVVDPLTGTIFSAKTTPINNCSLDFSYSKIFGGGIYRGDMG